MMHTLLFELDIIVSSAYQFSLYLAAFLCPSKGVGMSHDTPAFITYI